MTDLLGHMLRRENHHHPGIVRDRFERRAVQPEPGPARAENDQVSGRMSSNTP
jgi:hypothetical protein